MKLVFNICPNFVFLPSLVGRTICASLSNWTDYYTLSDQIQFKVTVVYSCISVCLIVASELKAELALSALR